MKRLGFALLSFALSAVAAAQTGLLGTKAGTEVPVTTTSGTGGVGVGALIQMLIALGIVAFLLKWVLPKIAGKLTGKSNTKTVGGIKIEESLQVPGGALHVVSVRGRTFLVGSTPQTIQNLADLTEVQVAERDPFEETLDEAQPFDPAGNPNLEALAQLDRLDQLTGVHAQR